MQSRLSRRSALRHSAVLRLGVVGTTLLAACGGGTGAMATSAAGSAQSASSPTAAETSAATASSASEAISPAASARAAPTASATTASAAISTPAAAGHLTVWMWWADPVDSVKQFAATYSAQHAGTTIDVLSPSDYWNKVQTTIAGDVGPANRKASFDMIKWTSPLSTAVNATWDEITKPANDLQGKILQGQVAVQDGLHQMADLVNAVLSKS